jgi:asparagine synthase (glutamine-hydrolysing)
MCGIYGYYSFRSDVSGDEYLEQMALRLHHRGPDGVGLYSDQKRVGLGNVRLSIIDPEGGDQPYFSDDGNVIVVQNGEIFNFRELRKDLVAGGAHFSSDCDTEVLLHLYLKKGIKFLSMLNGMFTIAIYDKRKQSLYLARDRIGEKPLYFYKNEEILYFGSEIKAFSPYIKKNINHSALNAFLRLNYVPAPYTAFEDVFHVMPGTYLTISEKNVNETKWWDLTDQNETDNFSEQEWQDEFLDILDDSVRLRLVSDVPFGAFLSGGVDSSSVVGLMAKHMDRPVKTYSIGFPDPRFDESMYAEMAAKRFKTEHHSKIVDYDIVSEWSDFIYYCDQPHGDVSFMPMRKVSELAASDVKMVLTGDGADELFAGYEKHVPFLSRDDIGGLDSKGFLNGYLPYLSMFSTESCKLLWKEEFQDKIDWSLVEGELKSALDSCEHFDPINRGLFLDMKFLLSGNNLVKPDRMAMSMSLETRAPFLDYRMMEFAFRTPGIFKLKDGDKKHLYKKAVTPLIGKDLAFRKKQMFTVPIGEWFRGELSKYCYEILLSDSSRIIDFFSKDYMEDILEKHINGIVNYTREIRALIAIELWLTQLEL